MATSRSSTEPPHNFGRWRVPGGAVVHFPPVLDEMWRTLELEYTETRVRGDE